MADVARDGLEHLRGQASGPIRTALIAIQLKKTRSTRPQEGHINMKPIWTAASAALLAVGALMGSTAASQAGGASASHASKSETLSLVSKAYSRKHRRHRRHGCRRHCGGGGHDYHGDYQGGEYHGDDHDGQYDDSGATDLYYGDRKYDRHSRRRGQYSHYGDDDHGESYGHDSHDDQYENGEDSGHYGSSAHYDRRVHGPRYRTRRAGYIYKYAGYWYSRKWWVPVRAHSYGGGHLSHREWCREQYGRYYDPYSNTYSASDGRSYRCIRPKRR